jgi:hypothetical protein
MGFFLLLLIARWLSTSVIGATIANGLGALERGSIHPRAFHGPFSAIPVPF